MAVVWIPDIASEITNGISKVEVPGETVAEIIVNLDLRFPGIGGLLIHDHALRRGIMVAVDGNIGSRNLLLPVSSGSEVHFIPAISGG